MALQLSRTFHGVVWGTFAVPEYHLVIIEVRDTEAFVTNFSALDYKSGKWVWENKSLDEKWWVTPVGSVRDVVLFQTYHHGANPDLKGLLAVDAMTAKPLWKRDNFAFHDIRDSMVLGYAIPEMAPYSIDSRTGKATEGFVDGKAPETAADLKIPVAYYENSKDFSTCSAFVGLHTGISPVGVIEYLEAADKILIGCYVKESENLANYLLVFDPAGKKVLHERLGEGLGKETFFVVGGCLIFVKNKSELYSYRIA